MLTHRYPHETLQSHTLQIDNSQIALIDQKGKQADVNHLNDIAAFTVEIINSCISSKVGKYVFSNIIESDRNIYLKNVNGENGFNYSNGTIEFNPLLQKHGFVYNQDTMEYTNDGPAEVGLIHEMGHALDWVDGTFDNTRWINIKTRDGIEDVYNCEKNACNIENMYRREANLPQRISYSSTTLLGKPYISWRTILPPINEVLYNKIVTKH